MEADIRVFICDVVTNQPHPGFGVALVSAIKGFQMDKHVFELDTMAMW